jgi:hypothetical protein
VQHLQVKAEAAEAEETIAEAAEAEETIAEAAEAEETIAEAAEAEIKEGQNSLLFYFGFV